MRELDVRLALHASELAKHRRESSTLIIDELGLNHGFTRIDVAVINGAIHGYEIKSARDTLARLPDQAKVYSSCLDFVTLVTADNHLERGLELIPPWWGVQLAIEKHGQVSIEVARRGSRNPSVDPVALGELLWKPEALGILEELGAARGFRSKRLQVILERLAELLSIEQLSERVRETLKRRPGWRADAIRTGDDGWCPPASTSADCLAHLHHWRTG